LQVTIQKQKQILFHKLWFFGCPLFQPMMFFPKSPPGSKLFPEIGQENYSQVLHDVIATMLAD